MTAKARGLVSVGVAVAVLAFGLYVWPTPYRALTIKGYVAARVTRVGGHLQVLGGHGWLCVENIMPPLPANPTLDDLARHYGVDRPPPSHMARFRTAVVHAVGLGCR